MTLLNLFTKRQSQQTSVNSNQKVYHQNNLKVYH